MAIKKREKRSIPKKIKVNKSKGKDGFPENKDIRRAFKECEDKSKYEARLLRRKVNGAFGREKVNDYNKMVIGTRGKKKVEK